MQEASKTDVPVVREFLVDDVGISGGERTTENMSA
jgi:hypothetical protein